MSWRIFTELYHILGDITGGSGVTKCNLYQFKSTNSDRFDFTVDFTGNLKAIIAGTSSAGIHPNLLAGVQGTWQDSTDLDNLVWNQLEIEATAIGYLADNTFNGVVASYAKDDVWFDVDMGAPH